MKHFKNEDLNNLFPVKFNNYSKLCSPAREIMPSFHCLNVFHSSVCVSLSLGVVHKVGEAELNSFSKITCHNILRRKNILLKNEARDLDRRFSLMLIFMSASCMSLIYLLLIFRGKVRFFRLVFCFVTKFFYSRRAVVLNVAHERMLMFLFFSARQCCMASSD